MRQFLNSAGSQKFQTVTVTGAGIPQLVTMTFAMNRPVAGFDQRYGVQFGRLPTDAADDLVATLHVIDYGYAMKTESFTDFI